MASSGYLTSIAKKSALLRLKLKCISNTFFKKNVFPQSCDESHIVLCWNIYSTVSSVAIVRLFWWYTAIVISGSVSNLFFLSGDINKVYISALNDTATVEICFSDNCFYKLEDTLLSVCCVTDICTSCEDFESSLSGVYDIGPNTVTWKLIVSLRSLLPCPHHGIIRIFDIICMEYSRAATETQMYIAYVFSLIVSLSARTHC